MTGYLCSLPWWLTGSDETAAQGYRGAMTTPVVLVHGWGGSFESTWQRSGFTELLRDAGRPVIGVDLLGHGSAPKPHDPEAYADLGARVLDAIPPEPVDAVEGNGDPDDNISRLFANYGNMPGNDVVALTAVMRRTGGTLTTAMVASATCETLVAIGDRDFAGPGEVLAGLIKRVHKGAALYAVRDAATLDATVAALSGGA